jgi:hypothetical protein
MKRCEGTSMIAHRSEIKHTLGKHKRCWPSACGAPREILHTGTKAKLPGLSIGVPPSSRARRETGIAQQRWFCQQTDCKPPLLYRLYPQNTMEK